MKVPEALALLVLSYVLQVCDCNTMDDNQLMIDRNQNIFYKVFFLNEVLQKPLYLDCKHRPSDHILKTSEGDVYSMTVANTSSFFYSLKAILETYNKFTFTWKEARDVCRRMCMEPVVVDSLSKLDYVKHQMLKYNLANVWTSGRKCDTKECDDSYKPTLTNGWYWTNTNQRIPDTRTTTKAFNKETPWAPHGATYNPQPDNYESKDGHQESCLMVKSRKFDNLSESNFGFHDKVCTHEAAVVCEDSRKLLDYVKHSTGMDVRLPIRT